MQIISKKNNNYNKKLQEKPLSQPHINKFSLKNKRKDSNELKKNNFILISKAASGIYYNDKQDLSFISNSKGTENLLDINGININDYKINCTNTGNIFPKW